MNIDNNISLWDISREDFTFMYNSDNWLSFSGCKVKERIDNSPLGVRILYIASNLAILRYFWEEDSREIYVSIINFFFLFAYSI